MGRDIGQDIEKSLIDQGFSKPENIDFFQIGIDFPDFGQYVIRDIGTFSFKPGLAAHGAAEIALVGYFQIASGRVRF
jgi:hypothetical protein